MFKPSTVLLEFITWFGWLALFASVQSRLCQKYPEIRDVCRKAYIFTMVVPIVGSAWLMMHAENGTDMFAVLNHGFGAGVFAQTALRALVLLKWLVVSSLPHYAAAQGGGTVNTLYAEGDLVALVGVLGQTLRKPVARERGTEISRERKIAE